MSYYDANETKTVGAPPAAPATEYGGRTILFWIGVGAILFWLIAPVSLPWVFFAGVGALIWCRVRATNARISDLQRQVDKGGCS